jgi:hypothetical protein
MEIPQNDLVFVLLGIGFYDLAPLKRFAMMCRDDGEKFTSTQSLTK